MSEYFPKPSSHEENITVEIDLSNYATKKQDIKNIPHVDTSNFTLKTNLSSLKAEVDKLDINKLVPILNDLSELSDVSDLVTKAQLNVVENKILRASDLVTKNDLITIQNKIPNTSNIASKSDLTAVENKIPNISNLATKQH